MSQLVVLSFEGADEAAATLQSVRSVERAGQLKLLDTAVVSKAADGKVSVKNEVSSATETGTVVGAVLGPMLMFMFPIAGIAVGAAAGAGIGRMLDQGIDGKFVKEVKETLEPGSSALFLLIAEGNPAAGLAAVRGHKGKVLQTTLSPELEEELNRAMR